MADSYLLDKNYSADFREEIRRNLKAHIDRLEGSKSWRIEIKRAVKERTDVQNHALFGVAYPALEKETGFTKDELHFSFCCRFFGTVTKEVLGKTIYRPYRTTTNDAYGERDVLSTEEFARFYDMVQMVGAEAGIVVPDPDPLFHVKNRWAR